jgi:hypothetical protein
MIWTGAWPRVQRGPNPVQRGPNPPGQEEPLRASSSPLNNPGSFGPGIPSDPGFLRDREHAKG